MSSGSHGCAYRHQVFLFLFRNFLVSIHRLSSFYQDLDFIKYLLSKIFETKSATPPSFRIAFSDHLAAIPNLLL